MNSFPTIFDWIERLDFLRGMPATYLLLLAGLVVVAVWEWRIALFALTCQYLLAGLLFIEVLEPRLAIVKLLVGLFVSLMLYFTARQAYWPPSPQSPLPPAPAGASPWERIAPMLAPHNLLFRIFLALVLLLLLLTLAQRPGYQLPAVPPPVNLAIFGLSGLGLLGLALTDNPLRAGMALLLVMLAFELFYNSLEQSVLMLIALAVVNLAIALAVGYLTQAHTRAQVTGEADPRVAPTAPPSAE